MSGSLPPLDPPAPGRPPSGPGATLGRFATQAVALAAVAVGTLWLVERRDAARDGRMDALQGEMAELRYERDRMQRLNQELAREVHDAGVASEIARWQLRWTEERLRRTEAELAAAQARRGRAAPPAQPSPALDLPIAGRDVSLPPTARVEALDDAAAAELSARLARIAEGDGRSEAFDPGPVEGLGHGNLPGLDRASIGGPIDPESIDPELPELRRVSQLARNEAYLDWKQVVGEAVEAECGRRATHGALRCQRELEALLFAYGERAVTCVLSGNAPPDYVPVTDLDALPSHSIPLEEGAIILCDGALANP